MIELIFCLGLHWILKYGTILNKPRRLICNISLFNELFKCSLCLGFWVGVIGMCLTDNILLPFASAGFCWFVDNLNNMIQSVEIKLDNQD